MPTSIPCHLTARLLLRAEAELLWSLTQLLFATRVLRHCPNMCSCATYSIYNGSTAPGYQPGQVAYSLTDAAPRPRMHAD